MHIGVSQAISVQKHVEKTNLKEGAEIFGVNFR